LNTSEIVMENYFMSRYLEGENMICKGKYMWMVQYMYAVLAAKFILFDP
jgi:hypothetical protein